MLIAAQSGRALAASARRAGYLPLVADLHGDDDTRALAARTARLSSRFDAPALLRALDELSEGTRPVGLAYGSLLESRPALLDAAVEKYPLLGNRAEVVRRVKDPRAFAALCRDRAVPHPGVAAAPGEGEWLEKRAGASGGAHVRPARPGRRVRPPRYVQRRVVGEPVSALFLADGRRAMALGFSAQWAAPTPGQPFRYGGAARPARLDPALAAAMAAAVDRVAGAAGLVGLNAADFLVHADGFALLEINPRAGAALDVFEPPTPPFSVMAGLAPAIHDLRRREQDADARIGTPSRERAGTRKSGHDGPSRSGDPRERALFSLHVKACRGTLPARAPRFPGAAASAVAYARRAMSVRAGFAWPDWAADRQGAGRPVAEGAPFCTVSARAGTLEAARALAAERVGIILGMAEEA